jgi:hypothetical protein
MPLETVHVLLQTDEITPQPVDGVGVRVYSSDGITLLTEGVSGDADDGLVEFVLDGTASPGTESMLLFYIIGGAIQNPQRIQVISPPGDNNFEITVSQFTLPTSPYPRLCRVSGYVLGPTGSPLPGVDMHFMRCSSPISIDGSLVLGERAAQRTSKSGWFEIDLLRGSSYHVTVDTLVHMREIFVPDVAGIRLSDLLFPVVRSVELTPAGPWSIAEGASLDVTVEATVSDYRVLEGTAREDIIYEVDDASVVGLSVCSDRLVLTGRSPGSATLTVTRRDTSIQHVPADGDTLATISVTVV